MDYEIINLNGLYLKFVHGENGALRLCEISAEGGKPKNKNGFIPFVVSKEGETSGATFGGFDGIFKNDLWRFQQTGLTVTENRVEITYSSQDGVYDIKTVYESKCNAAAVYQTNEITAKKAVALADFYSLVPLCEYTYSDGENFTLSYRRNRWQTEGQWFTSSFKDLGFNDFCELIPMNKFTVTGSGSHTTSEYYPCFIVGNLKTGEKFFVESEADSEWFERASQFSGWDEEKGALLLSVGTIEERTLKSRVCLNAGESYKTPPVLIAAAFGGEDLFKTVYAAKRAATETKISEPTVIFNDYMNCLWAQPSWEKEKSLIDACAKYGVKYFVIDDGWYIYKDEIGCRLGDWNFDGEVFGELGLKGVIDYIIAKGMKPGIWVEGEVVGENSKIYKTHPEYVLTVNGARYGSYARRFLDFRKKEVWNYLGKVYDDLYSLGIRYVKIDYNDAYALADGKSGTTDGLKENYAAVVEFYKGIKRKYPDLILENCASGGKREDEYILKHFDLQSVSDQMEYNYYPSVICGSLVNNVPEKTGVWCMPYPVRWRLRNADFSSVPVPTDEEIIFNLVNGLTGVITLSSFIDKLDDRNSVYLKDALKLYPKIFEILNSGYPSYPLGLTRGEDKKHALKINSEKGELLYLWATGDNKFDIEGAQNFVQLFPIVVDSVISENGITLKDKLCARIFIRARLL